MTAEVRAGAGVGTPRDQGNAHPRPGVWRLAFLLGQARVRSARHAFSGGSRRSGARAVGLVMLLVPAAYTALFATALSVIGEVRGPVAQGAALALVSGAIVLASLATKVASGEAVSGTGDTEFLLARPVSLGTLVAARSLAGVVTDPFDALFLLPVLVAAVVSLGLPAGAVGAAVLTSICAQIAVTALAQLLQIGIVQRVPPRHRRTAWAVAALVAALCLALMWMLGTAVLRDPAAVAARLAAAQSWLELTPAGWLSGPVMSFASMGPHLGGAAPANSWRAVGALGGLALASAACVAVASAAAVLAGRRGWEVAGHAFAEAAHLVPERRGRRPLSLFGKDLLLIARDRARLVTLVAMPAIFVGLQVFGSAGLAFITATPHRSALVAYSLAAYAATFGPLGHMEAERRAFWILRAVPVSLPRLMAGKALFWSVFVGALGLVTYAGLVALGGGGGAASPWAVLGPAALVAIGAVSTSFLGVGLACGAADLTHEGRHAVGFGTVYLFMLVAGLFNVVFIETQEEALRALLLFLVATGLCFTTGVARVRDAFDAEAMSRRRLHAGTGAVLAVVLALGQRASARATGAMGWSEAGALVWPGVVGLGTLAYVWTRREPPRAEGGSPVRAGRLRAGLVGLVGAALGYVGARLVGLGSLASAGEGAHFVPLVPLAVAAAAEELVVRGVVQRALAAAPLDASRGAAHWRALGAAALSALLAALISRGSLTAGATWLAAIGPAVMIALGAGLPGAMLARAAMILGAR